MARPCIFLDRDGVINHNRADYVKSWSEFEFLPGALPALRELARTGWPIIVATNQAAIGRGLTSPAVVEDIHDRMMRAVRQAGGRIDAVLYCPHRAEDGCLCRKPQPGLLRRGGQALGADLPHSYLVGDAESDILAARKVECHPVLVLTGRGAEQLEVLRSHEVTGVPIARDLTQAAEWILAQANRERRFLEMTT